MTQATHFIDRGTGALVKGVHQLIPNLKPGGVVFLMKDKEHGYEKRKYGILRIETVIGDGVDTILQNVAVEDLGGTDPHGAVTNERRLAKEVMTDKVIITDDKVYGWVPDPDNLGCSACALRKRCERLEDSKLMLCDVLHDAVSRMEVGYYDEIDEDRLAEEIMYIGITTKD